MVVTEKVTGEIICGDYEMFRDTNYPTGTYCIIAPTGYFYIDNVTKKQAIVVLKTIARYKVTPHIIQEV